MANATIDAAMKTDIPVAVLLASYNHVSAK
jgi:hypothetical protein